jgi:hypothetical protein
MVLLQYGRQMIPVRGRETMSDLVHDERVKVAATFCNNLAVVCFATLAITPFGVQVFHLA